MKEINTRYDHTNENKIYKSWLKDGQFKPKSSGQPYTIVMPPPNVTGTLHAGHALVYSIHDVIARSKRRFGYSVLMLPGADHAAIAVESLVSKKIQKEFQKNRDELGREKFLEEVWRWINEYLPQIKDGLATFGVSCDWDRFRFTMDEESKHAVQSAFITLYQKGLIYRDTYLINWDIRLQTAVSDDEVVHQEKAGYLYWIKYGPITIATTRPETKLGDTAIAVNPNDHRYTEFVGKDLEFTNELGEKQSLPVIADLTVDPEFGTGALKVTPAHDHTDWELAKKHNLPSKQVIDQFGKMTKDTGKYSGLKVNEAREQIIKDLQDKDLIEKITSYSYRQPHSERSGSVIEPLPSMQWFVRTTQLKERSLLAVKNKEIVFFPDSVKKTYYHWLTNLHDWCISRQLWWGHQIPAYYTPDGQVHVLASNSKELVDLKNRYQDDLKQDTDVLDTWFSSGLWPLTTLGWPNSKSPDLKKYFPTDLIITGSDILFFWIARMIMLSLALTEKVPFKQVYFHGLVLDENGQKMSKSKGNALDPSEVVKKYGADTLRMSLIGGNSLGQDQRFSEQKLLKYRNFTTKIWNASRFIALTCQDAKDKLEIDKISYVEQEFFKKLSTLEQKNQKLLQSFQLGLALEELYEFFWHEFADKFLEYEKKAIQESSDEKIANNAKNSLKSGLNRLLVLIDDFAPFLVSEIRDKIIDVD